MIKQLRTYIIQKYIFIIFVYVNNTLVKISQVLLFKS